MHKNLVVDLNNCIFIVRHSAIKTPSSTQQKESYVAEYIFKETINFISTFAMEQKADAIVIACDSPHVWRKRIYPEYKDKDREEDVYYQECIQAAEMTKEFFRECTNASVLEVPKTEADDIIAVFCQESEGVENVIVSSDKDFVQLINGSTTLYSPSQKKFRVSEDPEYDLFFKCIRGDNNDNIPSAFPRVREKKLKEAWENPLEMQNLVETVRKDGKKVADALEFNRSLIDLKRIPEDVKNAIRAAIVLGGEENYTEFGIMKYLAKNNLKEHKDMLSYKDRPLKSKAVQKQTK